MTANEQELHEFLDEQDDLAWGVDLGRTATSVPATGWHTVRVAAVERKVASTGTPFINVRLEIVGEDDPDKGKPLWDKLFLTEESRWRMEGFLNAIMAPGEGVVPPETFIGSELRVLVDHRDFEARTMADIRQFAPLASLGSPVAASGFGAPKKKVTRKRKPKPLAQPTQAQLEEEEEEAKAVAPKSTESKTPTKTKRTAKRRTSKRKTPSF